MRRRLFILAAALAGCFNDAGPPDLDATTTGTSTTTIDPTTGEAPGCGDGVVQDGEACDDGEANAQYAACNKACVANICGDGVRGPDELCDDGDADENNGCTTLCAPPRCGDGFVQVDEKCDDGDDDESDACTSMCTPPLCGDGIVSEGEQCDLGADNADAGFCTTLCTTKLCGDGHVQPGEACDSGAAPMMPCTADCTYATCGNGELDEPEACDMADTPTCTPLCTAPVCGDGFVSEGEDCDDGDPDDDDECTSACKLSTCGDGIADKGEQCDDGNEVDGDACDVGCTRGSRYVFVSSLRYAGGAIGTLNYADSECQELAAAALLPGNYRAWLSNGAISPATRFSKSLDRPYILPFNEFNNGTVRVADGWLDLVDGSLQHAIDVTEKGERLTTGDSCAVETQIAWTATARSAGPFDTTSDCKQWSTSVPQAHGVAGLIGGTDVGWTEGCTAVGCDLKARLYCFEQP